MKKTGLFVCVLCMCLVLALFAGCTQKDESTEASVEASTNAYTIADNSAEEHLSNLLIAVQNNEVIDGSYKFTTEEETNFSEIVSNTPVVLEYGSHDFGNGNSTYSLIVFTANTDAWNPGYYFLCVEQDGQFSFYYFDHFYNHVYSFSLLDFDGDGYDEILTTFVYATMSTDSSIRTINKVVDGTIEILFRADGTYKEDRQVNSPDPEFEFAFQDEYTIAMRSLPANYTSSFDAHEILDDELLDVIYDDNRFVDVTHDVYGRLFEKDIWVGNYQFHYLSPFFPIDIDDDGTYEIIAGRVFIYKFQFNVHFGTEYTLLKYNYETETFEIIDAVFETNSGHNWARANPDYEVFGVPIGEIYGINN